MPIEIETTVRFNSTKLIKVDPLNPEMEIIQEAAAWILDNEVVAFPTETVYGLGANATNDSAVKNIYLAKNRPSDNPLIAHFSTIEQINNYVEKFPRKAMDLAEIYWPGPLTLVLEKNDKISSLVTQNLNTVAVRIPAHSVALKLIEVADVPIAAPSANLSGRPSPTLASHVANDLNGRIPMILDGGSTLIGVESTVISLMEENPILLRPGGITTEELQKHIPELVIPKNLASDAPISPGMKYIHYSPNSDILIIKNGYNLSSTELDELVVETKNSIILCTNTKHTHNVEYLQLGKTLREIQANLFASFRLLDDRGIKTGFFEEVSYENEGYVIMNRVEKAAKGIIGF